MNFWGGPSLPLARHWFDTWVGWRSACKEPFPRDSTSTQLSWNLNTEPPNPQAECLAWSGTNAAALRRHQLLSYDLKKEIGGGGETYHTVKAQAVLNPFIPHSTSDSESLAQTQSWESVAQRGIVCALVIYQLEHAITSINFKCNTQWQCYNHRMFHIFHNFCF